MRIAVAGSGHLGASVLVPLLESSHEVVGIVQNGRELRGWRRALSAQLLSRLGGGNSLLRWASRRRLPVVWIDRMTEEELAPLRVLEPDILLVSGFSIILKPPLLRLPRVGCVNMHSSLLPRHRGPNPFSAVVLAGDPETGVTFHVMDEGIDTGDILDQAAFAIDETATMVSVYRQACELASERVVPLMDRIEREGLRGRPQDPAGASYEKKPKADDARLDWNAPARELDRLVRALAPTTMPWFLYKGRKISVARLDFDAAPVEAAPGTVLQNRPLARIATGEGTVRLRIAYIRVPLPWLWPAPWSRPERGERLGGP